MKSLTVQRSIDVWKVLKKPKNVKSPDLVAQCKDERGGGGEAAGSVHAR